MTEQELLEELAGVIEGVVMSMTSPDCNIEQHIAQAIIDHLPPFVLLDADAEAETGDVGKFCHGELGCCFAVYDGADWCYANLTPDLEIDKRYILQEILTRNGVPVLVRENK